jgi:hypothetical protein
MVYGGDGRNGRVLRQPGRGGASGTVVLSHGWRRVTAGRGLWCRG